MEASSARTWVMRGFLLLEGSSVAIPGLCLWFYLLSWFLPLHNLFYR